MNPPSALTPEQAKGFESLGLLPGEWGPLYAVPILRAVRRIAERRQRSQPGWPADDVAAVIAHRAAVAAGTPGDEPEARFAEFSGRFLSSKPSLSEQHLRLGEALLCVHFAHDLTPLEREQALGSLENGDVFGRDFEAYCALGRSIDEFRELIDARLRDVPSTTPEVTVTVAEPFPGVTWDEALAAAPDEGLDFARIAKTPLLFSGGRPISIGRNPDKVPNSLWFIGDLHGDLLALENAWRFIRDRDGDAAHVVFLGDFVDRGSHSHETLVRLFGLIVENPGRVGVVLGNHDENFVWDEQSGQFLAPMRPAEYADQLTQWAASDDPACQRRVEVGRFAEQFFKRCPRAIFLPDGTLIAHGGFPHVDLLEGMTKLEDLAKPECLSDFVWLRANPTAPRKRPNRASRGCEFGHQDFAKFREHVRRFGLSVDRMVRGHDHVPERFECYERYGDNPVLTLNTMCRPLEDEILGTDNLPMACVARHVPGSLPEVFRLPIDPEQVLRAFPREAEPVSDEVGDHD